MTTSAALSAAVGPSTSTSLVGGVSTTKPPPSPRIPNLNENSSHCIILCAGIANPPIEPFTRVMPKCFLPVAGQPILHHIVRSFIGQGVQDFTIVIGAHAQYFTEAVRADLKSLLPDTGSLTICENPFFWNNGPADSLRAGFADYVGRIGGKTAVVTAARGVTADRGGMATPTNSVGLNRVDFDGSRGGGGGSSTSLFEQKRSSPTSSASARRANDDHVSPVPFSAKNSTTVYVAYGDVVFTDVALQRLVQSPHRNAVLIDRAVHSRLRGAKSRETSLNELEMCSVRSVAAGDAAAGRGGHESMVNAKSVIVVDEIGIMQRDLFLVHSGPRDIFVPDSFYMDGARHRSVCCT